jgi:Mrp family chromosome partitioning ATPase
MVLLDSPPLLPVTDAAVLTRMAGGALIVVGADRIHRPQLLETLGALETARAHIFGIVVNKIDRREAGAYAYDSYAPLDNSSVAPASRAMPPMTVDQTVEMWVEPDLRREKLHARSH